MSRSPARFWQKVLFGLAFTALLLAAAEGILRLAGVRPALYEQDPYVGFSAHVPLFVEETGPEGRRWRVTAANKLELFNAQRFEAEKPDGVRRVFCVGGSTTYGRPYQDSTSFAGWLREALPRMDPSHRWEVVNAGGISYASYRVALLMEELANYQPDLFVVYSGQNEFLERRTYSSVLDMPMPVRTLGATFSRTSLYTGLSRLMSAKRQHRVQADVLPAEVETILEESVGPEAYTRDDAWQQSVIGHYRYNLARMVDIARSAGAQIVLVTPASNLSDCSPFKSQADDPRTPQRLTEATGLFEQGRVPEALDAVDAVLRADPRDADAHYLRGHVLQALGRPGEAREAYQRALDEDVCPLRALSRMQQVVTEVAAEREVPCLDFAAVVAEQSPQGIAGASLFLDHVHPTIEGHRLLAEQLARVLREQGMVTPAPSWSEDHWDDVARVVRATVDRTQEAAALRNLAKVLEWAGKSEDSARLADRALALAPADPEALNTRGLQLAEAGRLDEAIDLFERALAAQPDFDKARIHLGNTLVAAGRPREAIEQYQRVLTADPSQYKARNNLGNAYEAMGETGQAEAAYRAVLAARPRDITALYNLGNLHALRNELEDATHCFEQALAVEPDYADAQYGLGLVLGRQRRPREARGHLQRAIELRPTFADAHYVLGLVEAQLGEVAAARRHLERTLELRPGDEAARTVLAELPAAQGENR